jgi:hypothetical protein
MLKFTRFFVFIPLLAVFLGCNNTQEVDNSPDAQAEMKSQIAEQQQKIEGLEKAQAEQEKMKMDEEKQAQIKECQTIKEVCTSKLAVIGTEEIELFNDHGTSYGIVKGDRKKAIEELKEEIEKDEEYIEDKEDEIKDYNKDGNVYEVIKDSLERKEGDIDRSEKKIRKIEQLIIQEQNQKNALLNGECANYDVPCE